MTFFRTGIVKPFRGTAIADPGRDPASAEPEPVGITTADTTKACVVDEMTPTFSLNLVNRGGAPLYVYFDSPRRPDIYLLEYRLLKPNEVLDGLFELRGLWLLGQGETVDWEMLLGKRVT